MTDNDNNPNTCVCCEGVESTTHLAALRRCCTCGHVWADLHLSPDEVRALYTEHYFKGEEYLDYEQEAPALRRNFRARVNDLAQRYPRGASLWEIGAAYGYFLQEASAHFTVAGCDIAEEAVKKANQTFGLDIQHCDYLSLPSRQHDVICLWDTVEHLQAPHRYIEKAARELRPGGTLALSTGDIGSLCARLRGAKWRLIHPPTHLHYFSRHSMTVLLRRLGFTSIEVRYHPFWRSFDAAAVQILDRPGAAAGKMLYRWLKSTGLTNLCFPLNLYDLMTVYARKP